MSCVSVCRPFTSLQPTRAEEIWVMNLFYLKQKFLSREKQPNVMWISVDHKHGFKYKWHERQVFMIGFSTCFRKLEKKNNNNSLTGKTHLVESTWVYLSINLLKRKQNITNTGFLQCRDRTLEQIVECCGCFKVLY